MNDLNIMAKIRSAAEFLGMTVAFAGSKELVGHYLTDSDLLIVDLENDFIGSIDLIERIKSDKVTASIKMIGYLSDVNGPPGARAIAAGCDEVLSRFDFGSNAGEILQAACT